MTDFSTLMSFAALSLAIALSPGPSWLYVATTTVRQGRKVGMVAVLGNASGIVCHVLFAALGLSALLAYSAAAYSVVKWLGAGYLIYLGVRTIVRGATSRTESREGVLKSYGKVFRDGVLVNVLNPKVALLMLALLPQFVDPSRGNVALQTMSVGMIHSLIATLVLTVVAWAADRSAALVKSSATTERFFRWTSGSLLIGLGARLALADEASD